MESAGIEKNMSSRKKWLHLSIIVMLFLILAPISGSDSLELDDDLPRVPRAIDPLEMSLERMRMISRIATGIHLVQEIVNGTADVDQITSELLRMGSVTPSLIAKMNATELEGIIELIRNVGLEGTEKNKTTHPEQSYLKTVVEINEFMQNISNITDWPGKSAFEATVKGHTNKSDTLKVALDFKDEGEKWTRWIEKTLIGKHEDAWLDLLNDSTIALLELTPKLKADEIMFSPTGTAMEKFEQPFKTAKYVEVLKNSGSYFYYTKKVTENVFALGRSLKPFTSHFRSMKSALTTRNSLRFSKIKKITTGFYDGVDDLAYLPHDVTEEWMSRMMNSSKSLEKYMEIVKPILHSLKNCDKKMDDLKNRHFAAIAAIDKQTTLLEMVLKSSNDTATVFGSIDQCHRVYENFDEKKIFSILPFVQQLDDGFLEMKEKVTVAFKKKQKEEIMTMLEKLKRMLSGKLTTEIKAEIKTFLVKIHKPMDEFFNKEVRWYDTVGNPAKDLHAQLGNVTDFYSIATYKGAMVCIKAVNMHLLKETLVLLESLRSARYVSSTTNEDAVTVIQTITGLSDELNVAMEAMRNLKGQKTAESEHLKLLKDPKNTAFIIGKTVQWVVLMNEVSKKMAEIQKVIDNLELIKPELSKTIGVFLEDAQHLMALSGLKDKFETLKTELSLWKDEVSNVRVEKLEDASRIYTPGDRVTGIYENLTPMVASLGNLIAAYPNSSVIHNLNSLKQSLDVLIMYDLNFLNYKVVPLEADESFSDLATFFTNFSSAMSSSPTTVTPSEPRLEKDEDGLRSSSGNETSKQDSSDWFTDDTLTSLTIVLICVCCLFSVIGTFCSQCKELKDQRAELAELKSRNRDLSAQADQLQIENNRMSKSAESNEKRKGRKSRTASSMMSAESRSKEVAE